MVSLGFRQSEELECNLNVKIITEGVHSGDGSGVIPDTMRIIRMVTYLGNKILIWLALR